MFLYRITTQAFAYDLSGRGALSYGGRWNPKGIAVLYTAETPAQALLEFLPHFPDTCTPPNLVLVTILAPDNLEIEEVTQGTLSEGWDAKPPTIVSTGIGREWLKRGVTAALRVPSVMLPFGKSWNVVLNPAHGHCSDLKIIEVTALSVDPRLLSL